MVQVPRKLVASLCLPVLGLTLIFSTSQGIDSAGAEDSLGTGASVAAQVSSPEGRAQLNHTKIQCVCDGLPGTEGWDKECYTTRCDASTDWKCVASPVDGPLDTIRYDRECIIKPRVCLQGRIQQVSDQNAWTPITPCCGNNVIEAGEECDGSALPPKVREGSTCLPSCVLKQGNIDTCEFYNVSMKSVRMSDANTELALKADGGGRGSSCLMSAVQRSFNWWDPKDKSKHWNYNHDSFVKNGSFRGADSSNGHKWSDDHVVTELWNQFLDYSGLPRIDDNLAPGAKQRRMDMSLTPEERKAAYEHSRRHLINCNKWADGQDFSYRRAKLGGGSGEDGQVACLDGWFAVDRECRLLDKSTLAGKRSCGGLDVTYYASTPVSLILEPSKDPMSHYGISRFPLDPSLPGRVWEWRGSNEAPVLVYDPKHTGEIASASQVFGKWTFGGKRTASIASQRSAPWSNGFEALAELDHDRDGKVAGRELEPLGLWFDADRDGVSQKGEVKPIRKVGIQALYYKVDARDPVTGDETVLKGFERTVDGKTIVGKSVDWAAKGHDSASGLVMGRGLADTDSLGGIESVLAALPLPPLGESRPAATLLQSRNVMAGAWMVKVEPSRLDNLGEFVGDGILVFEGGEGGTIDGYSFMTAGVNGRDDVSEIVRFSRVTGEGFRNASSTTDLAFSSQSKGASLTSQATIDASASTMKGVTRVVTKDGQTFTYDWSAHRIGVPK